MRVCKTLLLMSLTAICGALGAQEVFKPTAHYTRRMAAFSRMRPIDSTSVVMLGNSLTELGGDWSRRLQVKGVVNRGISGDDAAGIIHRLHGILKGRPKAVFLMVGINDLSHDLTAGQVAGKCKEVIREIRRQSPHTKLYVQSLLPINERFGRWKTLEGKTDDVPKINAMLQEYCKEEHIPFIPLFPKFVRKGTNELREPLSVDGLQKPR